MKSVARLLRLFVFACLLPSSGVYANYSNLFIFGDSLSDAGNNAVIFGANVTPVPISDNSFIPTFPYASGHYTNGPVWAQSFAFNLGLSASPSLLGGTDYAFGGATTGPFSPDLLSPFPPSLETQAGNFLSNNSNVAPSDALYVIAGGGNNARAALTAIALCGADFVCIGAVIQSTAIAFATDVATIVGELEFAGAKHIIVWDTPDVGLAPAVVAGGGAVIGTLLASSMNAALSTAVGSDPDVMLFDLFHLQDSIAADPAKFGLTNVTDACAQFLACDPSKYLFWDGIHPTSAGHMIISNAVFALVPEPATLALLGLGLTVLVASPRRKAG
jgi:outer membrane lipase/esterase